MSFLCWMARAHFPAHLEFFTPVNVETEAGFTFKSNKKILIIECYLLCLLCPKVIWLSRFTNLRAGHRGVLGWAVEIHLLLITMPRLCFHKHKRTYEWADVSRVNICLYSNGYSLIARGQVVYSWNFQWKELFPALRSQLRPFCRRHTS